MSNNKSRDIGIQKDTTLERISYKEWLDLSWKHFELLSSQRMQMINFYITIEVVLVGALFTLMNQSKRLLWAECIVAIAITLISLFFFGMDWRTRSMIHWSEESIKYYERMGDVSNHDQAYLMHYIESKSKKVKVTYSKLLWIQFGCIGILGITLFILLLLKVI